MCRLAPPRARPGGRLRGCPFAPHYTHLSSQRLMDKHAARAELRRPQVRGQLDPKTSRSTVTARARCGPGAGPVACPTQTAGVGVARAGVLGCRGSESPALSHLAGPTQPWTQTRPPRVLRKDGRAWLLPVSVLTGGHTPGLEQSPAARRAGRLHGRRSLPLPGVSGPPAPFLQAAWAARSAPRRWHTLTFTVSSTQWGQVCRPACGSLVSSPSVSFFLLLPSLGLNTCAVSTPFSLCCWPRSCTC